MERGKFNFGAGFSLRYDSRDHIYFPTKGELIIFKHTSFLPFMGNMNYFNRFNFTASKFYSLFNENNIIGFNFQVEYLTGEGSFCLYE